MNYKNGRQANFGDPVVFQIEPFGIIAGRLNSIMHDSKELNGSVAVPVMGGCSNFCVTIDQGYHAEDAFAALTAKAKPVS